MTTDPATLTTLTPEEVWDDTLDALACAIACELEDKGLLREGAADAVRYHFRGYGRRLLNPVLDQMRTEVQASQRHAGELVEDARRLQSTLRDLQRRRRRALLGAGLVGAGVAGATAILAALL